MDLYFLIKFKYINILILYIKMYNNLKREDILKIIDKIKISNYYKNKLKKINDEKKLRVEFSNLLNKYDKFIKMKKQIRLLIKKKNKLNRNNFKTKQKGGGKYNDIENILTDLKLKLDKIPNNQEYINKLNDLGENINELTAHKLLKESNKIINQVSRDQEKSEKQFEKMLVNDDFSKQNIKKYKEKMDNLKNEISNLASINTNLTKEMDKTAQELGNVKIDLEKKYESEISNLKKINEQLINEKNKILFETNGNNKKITEYEELLKSEPNSELQNKITELNLKNKELNKKLNDNKNCQNLLINKQNEVSILSSKFDYQRKELNEMKERVKNSDIEIKKLQNQLLEKNKEIATIINTKSILENKYKNIDLELQECLSKINTKNPLKKDITKINKLEEDKTQIKNEIKNIDDKKINAETELNEIKNNIEDVKQEPNIIKNIEKQIEEEEEEEKMSEILDKTLQNQDTPGNLTIEDELKKVDLIKPTSNNEGDLLINQGENLRRQADFLKKSNINPKKINEYINNQTSKLENSNNNLLQKKLPDKIKKIQKIYKQISPKVKDNLKITTDSFTDSDFQILRGGSHHIFKGGNVNYEEIMSRLNYTINNIQGNVNNLNFITKLESNFTNHVNKYNDSLTKLPKKILKRMSKGVIILYIRLLEDIMSKWEDLGWLKIIDDFFNLDYSKIENGNKLEIKKMSDKINNYKTKYKKPNFMIKLPNISEEIHIKLQEFWNNYYILIRKWYNILQKLSNKINGDQVIIMDSDEDSKKYFNNFNILREKLDDYQVLIRKKVSVYARINDIGRDESGFSNTQSECIENPNDFKCKKVKSDDYIMFGIFENPEYKNYLNLNINQCTNIKNLKNENPNLFKKIDRLSQLDNATKFDEIFFNAEFSNNKTISRYMLLDKLIANGIGVFLVTYGYSGVGKSFTLFGDDKNPGLLQSTISNISNIINTKLRIYEVYGLGLPYSDGYNNLENINQELIHYNLQISSTTSDITLNSTTTKKFKNIGEYINKINNIEEDKKAKRNDKIFLELPTKKDKLQKSLQSISKLISKIDNERKTDIPARVKPTVNNPESSRSILIYDFIFTVKLDNGESKEVSFVINDMPGLEDPIKTYIIENKKKIIFNGPKTIPPEIKNYLHKNYFTEALQYVTNPIKSYQELLLMSCLINPIYLSLLKPNDICYYFNEQNEKFRELVISNIENQQLVHSNNKIEFDNINKFQNKLLNNNKNSVRLNTSTQIDKDITKLSLDVMVSIIKICIETKNFNPMIDILSKILIDSKIPSDPTFNQEITLSEEELNIIKSKFQRKILAPYFLDFLLSNSASQLNVDKEKLSKVKKKILEISVNKGNGWNILKKYVRKNVNSIDDIIKKMLPKPFNKTNINLEILKEMRESKNKTYGGYVDAMIKLNSNINISFDIIKQVELYKKKQNIIYKNLEKMKKIVTSFVQIAFEALYINQNIAGILKYYSVISNIPSDTINNYVQKQNLNETSLNNNKILVQNHIDTLYDNNGMLVNLEINFEKIFAEIKNNTHSTKLFQTPEQEQNNELIVRDVINPYTEGENPRIQDFKMFYVLSNNNTQLKCISQAELFLNTREFIDNISA